MSQSEAPQPQSRSPYLWWGLAAIFVVGVLIALVLVLIFGQGSPQANPGPPSTAPATSTAPTESEPPAGPTECQLAAGSQQIPQEAPAAEWALNEYGALVPSSQDHGPAASGPDGVASCFSRDPAGALMAATHMLAALSQREDAALRERTVEQRVLDGPAKQETLQNLRATSINPSDPVTQAAGFRFVQYTDSDAYVTLAASVQGRDGIAVITYHLVWSDNDWYFSGEDFATGTGGPSSQLAEFTRWGQR